jgi:hypothetical protein
MFDDNYASTKSKISQEYVGFEVPKPAVMNVTIFWDIVPCSPYVNRRFGGNITSSSVQKSATQQTSVQQAARQKMATFKSQSRP